jgi:hypothetical protein
MFVTDREKIVHSILSLVSESESVTFDLAMKTWWQNIRTTGGLGLTYDGDRIFKSVGLDYWNFEIGPASSITVLSTAIKLDKQVPCPYYFYSEKKKRMIRVYDSRVATLVTLYGDFTSYLNTLLEKKND